MRSVQLYGRGARKWLRCDFNVYGRQHRFDVCAAIPIFIRRLLDGVPIVW
jgi:hypothetical protein